MNNIKQLLLSALVLLSSKSFSQDSEKLWYNQPAKYFEETLVLGNGKMGASVFGGYGSETIYLNDASLWSGEPVDANMNPEAYKNLPAIREALKNEDYWAADSLNKKLQGKFSHSYAPFGTMYIDFLGIENVTNYYRELDISKATAMVRYEANGVKYTREYFVSYPDKVMIIKMNASKPGALQFKIRLESLLKNQVAQNGEMLSIKGYAPIYAAPSYFGNVPNAVIFEKDKGTRFTGLAKVKSTDGKLAINDSTLSVSGASEAILVVSLATSFNGYDKNPVTQGLDDAKIAKDQLNNAASKNYEVLKTAHIKDYQSFYNRISLNLGATTAPSLPTDERLKRYAEGKEDKILEILYFQYGRYLLISSSRTPAIPANLQGIWNPYMRPPWSSNYTVNINVEENYWIAEIANLSEMHMPLMDFIDNISKTGAITAKTFYGVQHGWVACHNSDIWAMSNPVGNFGSGDPTWANWNMGGTWLSTHLWEHYAFTKDKDFLQNKAYPLMKGAAQFCMEWLVEDKNGKLITSPSTSPENRYVTSNGYHGATLYGGTADLAMIRECLQQTIEATKILNIDSEFKAQLEAAVAKLLPYKIGAQGNLQEWYHDWADEDPKHRHQSHLFGLFPGHQILPGTTPDLAAACRKTLEIKGDETTGWSKGWRINLWARLADGNRAYKMYRELLRYVAPDGMRTNYGGGGGTYPNLFDAHPPFQIDGNFGGAAAVIEMLVQSDMNQINILPALPDAWETGSIKGVCARGGFELSFSWENKNLKKVEILSKNGGKTVLKSGSKSKEISLKKGEKVSIDW